MTADGEAVFYAEHRPSRKEVLWRKMEAYLQYLIQREKKKLLHSFFHFVPTKDADPK